MVRCGWCSSGVALRARNGHDGVLVGVDAQQTAVTIKSSSMTRTELLDRPETGAQADAVLVLDPTPARRPARPVSTRGSRAMDW